MSFLKVERKASGMYLRIVESYRNEEGKSCHRVVHSLGKVSDYTPDQLRSIGLKLYELGGGDVKALMSGSIEELARYNYGYFQVYYKAFCHYGLDVIVKRIIRKHKIGFDLQSAVLLMLIERLQDPCSKRSNYINQSDYIGLEPVYLHQLYRSLDKLADYSELIQKQIFSTGRDLFNQQLDVVFYDVTTLYFESADEFEEGNRQLRKKGFSKDGKIGSTQVLFCMMIDRNKNPIGYQVFKGNTYEGHTLAHAITTLKNRYAIDKVIVVADRVMMSKVNIDTVTDCGYEFIVGDRLKNMSPKIKKQLLNLSTYKQEWIYTDNDQEAITIRYTTLQENGKTIIATYSAKRAKKDKYDRDQILRKAQTLLDKPELLKSKAGRYYLKPATPTSEEDVVDEDKIKQQEKYDGFLAISTNSSVLTHTDILDQYKQLFKIEHCFRTFKSHLEMRPMFHWTDQRIEGHICLCFIAYTLQHYVLLKLQNFPIPVTESILRNMLDKMQVSLLQHNDEKVFLRSTPQPYELKLQQTLGLKQMPPIFSVQKFSKYC